jgi:hypothetical protein
MQALHRKEAMEVAVNLVFRRQDMFTALDFKDAQLRIVTWVHFRGGITK